jgi:hypothetical protein
MVKKLAEETAKALDEAEAAAEESGTATPALEPEKSKRPEPGTTEDTAEIINTDDSKSLSPNVTVSGTKPDGKGGYVLLDTVDPSVANAGHLPPRVHKPAENPSLPPESAGPVPGEGQVLFEVEADNEPFWSGNGVGQGGPLKKGEKVVMSKEEAELLVKTRAGRIVSASDDNAKHEGSDV